MALVLNLHHEIDKRRAISRRDPLKIAMGALVVIILGFAGYYFYQLNVAHNLESEANALEGEFNALDKKAAVAKTRADELNATIKASESLVKRVEGRFYWAAVLGELAQAVPPDIQIIRLSGDVNSDAVKRCSLTLEGIAAGPEPRKLAEDLRKALSDRLSAKFKNVTSAFKSLEDSNEQVKINGKPQKTVDFMINVQLQVGEEAPTPPPVTRKKKSVE